LNQKRRLALAVLLSFTFILPMAAQNRPAWERRPAQIHASDDRGALTFPSTASPTAVVAQFLASHGRDAAIVRTIEDTPTRNAIAGSPPARASRPPTTGSRTSASTSA
jgi:hypothetical protein